MLKFLSVQNFSVIEDIELELGTGLNIFTGETGAGKTLLINALKILTGEKLNRNFFRDETKPIRIQGIFSIDNTLINPEIIAEFEIDDEVLIKREYDINGKNRILINGHIATLKQLQILTESFVDIHGQHEHQLLLNPKNHLMFIDMLVEDDVKDSFHETYKRFKEVDAEILKLSTDIAELEKERDYLQFQIEELESLKVNVNEDLHLAERIFFLSNIDRLKTTIVRSLQFLRGDEVNVELLLTLVKKELDSIARYTNEMETLANRLDAIFYEIQDIAANLEDTLDKYDLDQSELNALIERKDRLDRVCKKYNISLDKVTDHLQSLKARLQEIDLRDERLVVLRDERERILATLKDHTNLLNEKRRRVSELLKAKITDILKELELKNANFFVEIINTGKIDEKGGIDLEFFISTNVGFAPAPLAKIASGGEISRVMLALKEAFSEVDIVGTLVFDEIDTGISGITAKKVADKLRNISKSKQVIVITHLPVVAAAGDKHFHLVKRDESGKSKTIIQELSKEDRVDIIASMIAGEITENSRKQAQEMLGYD
ncbi:MAG: DNA repair protein RecN [Calditerrivibrio sp.]|nr:DNA repair protein RecN [Calditerrivibrio sp.]